MSRVMPLAGTNLLNRSRLRDSRHSSTLDSFSNVQLELLLQDGKAEKGSGFMNGVHDLVGMHGLGRVFRLASITGQLLFWSSFAFIGWWLLNERLKGAIHGGG